MKAFMKLKTVLSFLFPALLLLVSCLQRSNRFEPVSQQEYEEALRQAVFHNLFSDSSLVTSSERRRAMASLTRWYGKDSVWARFGFVGKIPAARQYEVAYAGATDELHNLLLDSLFCVVPADSSYQGSLPCEYHAYSRTGLYAGEWWAEDAGTPPLDIRVWKTSGHKLRLIAELKDSGLCFPHAWDFRKFEDLRSLMFWGEDGTLYLKCHKLIKPKTGKRPAWSDWKHEKAYVYYKVRVDERSAGNH